NAGQSRDHDPRYRTLEVAVPGRALCGRRQRKLKSRATCGVQCGPQLSAVGLDDRATDGQAHSHPVRLRGEKTVEQFAHVIGMEPWSAIADSDNHFSVRRQLRAYRQRAWSVYLRGHCLYAIHQEVD